MAAKAQCLISGKKHKFIDQILKSWWSVDVCVTDSKGYSWIRYNPQVKPYTELDSKGNVIKYKYQKSDNSDDAHIIAWLM